MSGCCPAQTERKMFKATACRNSALKLFSSSVRLPQRNGEPLFTQPQPAEQRGRPLQLQDHLAGVCGGSGLLEGPAAARRHRPPLTGHRLLRQRRPAFLHQPAGAGALKGQDGEEEGEAWGRKI